MSNVLSSDLDSPSATPYFLWDEPMTIAELKQELTSGSDEERIHLLGKILREASDRDVWRFTTPQEVWQNWAKVSKHLGRRIGFWTSLFEFWDREGLLDEKHAR